MIKGVGVHRKTGKKTVFLGLSKGNTNELMKGNPIVIYGAELEDIDCDILIFGGKDEDDLARIVSGAWNDVPIRDQRKDKKQ